MSIFDESQKMALDTAYQGGLAIRNREIIPNLKAQRQELTTRIEKIDSLLAVLEQNKDFAKFFDLARELV